MVKVFVLFLFCLTIELQAMPPKQTRKGTNTPGRVSVVKVSKKNKFDDELLEETMAKNQAEEQAQRDAAIKVKNALKALSIFSCEEKITDARLMFYHCFYNQNNDNDPLLTPLDLPQLEIDTLQPNQWASLCKHAFGYATHVINIEYLNFIKKNIKQLAKNLKIDKDVQEQFAIAWDMIKLMQLNKVTNVAFSKFINKTTFNVGNKLNHFWRDNYMTEYLSFHLKNIEKQNR